MSRGQHVWKVEPGMSQEQVRELVGDPDFIDSDESWGYYNGCCSEPRYVDFDIYGQVSVLY
ncbi:MAG: outer membrane protein assembly factor BamE [Planctomycetaceae bacterium]